MKRSQIIVIGLLTFMLFALLFNSFITKIFSRYSICVFIFLLDVIAYFLLGFEKNKSRYNKDIILSLIIYITIYYISIYLFGLFIGFSKNVYNFDFVSIINNIVPVIILIFVSEILRYIINSKIKDSYLLLGLSIIVFTMIDITFTLNATNFGDFYTVLKVIGLFVLPSLGKNFLFTYLSVKVGFKPNMVYRYLMDIPKYILPIIPNFGAYVESILYIAFPILVFIIIYNNLKKVDRKVNKIIKSKKSKKTIITYYIIIPLLIITVALTSGYFKYQAIVVATGSMSPNINKGDIVVVKKLSDNEIRNLKIGDILVFNRENKIVVHRIYKIYSSGDEIFFKTKGDNNNAPDSYLIEIHEILGIVKLKVRYIGYPTVALYERINS
ncbi:MAG: signal peptidase I [bacterium]|nr:signal peptidase I [bacterium]